VSALRDAYELIRDEEHWCRGHMAIDEYGRTTNFAFAVRFCASGAAAKCETGLREDEALRNAALALFSIPVGFHGQFSPVVWVNDFLGHEAVVQVFEKALVELEGTL
jgi:hypothetical protein